MAKPCPDFDIAIRGNHLLSVKDGMLQVDGDDYNHDLADLSDVISTLSYILFFARDADQGLTNS